MSSVKNETNTNGGRKYWQSLDELSSSSEFDTFVGNEFPDIAADVKSPVTRRKFMTLMGASFALAGATACVRRPEEHILPYTRMPEDVLPGVPNHYATTFVSSGIGAGLVVESQTGRPTKIEGNPRHPGSLGAADAFAYASILQLYDPDRSHGSVTNGQYVANEEFESFVGKHFGALRAKKGAGLAILAGSNASPTLQRLREQMKQDMPQAGWYTWEPVNFDNQRVGLKTVFGSSVVAVPEFDKADVVLALDSDFIESGVGSLGYARKYAERRRVAGVDSKMNRLYAVEAYFSGTGGAADHRLRMQSAQIEGFVWALAAELKKKGVNIPGSMPAASNFASDFLSAVADDLAKNRGRGIIVAGDRQPPSVHAAVAALNEGLGNAGKTVKYVPDVLAGAGEGTSLDSIQTLVKNLNGSKVDTLVVLGGNPVYDAPAALNFAEALKKASTSIHLSLYWDETGTACTWHAPRAHYLESWGDARFLDGTASIVQPLIEPMFGGYSDVELVARILGMDSTDDYDVVRETWKAQTGGLAFDKSWRKWLHDGVVENSANSAAAVRVSAAGLSQALSGRKVAAAASASALELVFLADPSAFDGRFNNNAWLQEAPDPLTKLVWDNAAMVNPKTAGELGVETGDMLTVTVDGRSADIAAMLVPGLADGVLVLPLGYGRTHAGKVGLGTGFNVYPLTGVGAAGFASGASAAKKGDTYNLVTTQTYHNQAGRPLVREANVEEYRKHPKFAEEMVEHPPLISAWTEQEWNGQQWGMVIDLNTCTGCNACVIACHSENNIAVVGKEQIDKGREMSWIRLDRYFSGDAEDPQMVVQPIACMHCENAPCETVCPVAATAHGNEGTNDMAYNRCIGTRYCANNCPFKVRRFNYLDWHGQVDEMVKMVHNPDVTVRMRGVMEKCSYCVQRIHRAKRNAKVESRTTLRDGEVTPACAQACASESIVFGNINDPESRVAKLKARDLNYTLLAELNIKPRTTFMARIRNPHPKLA